MRNGDLSNAGQRRLAVNLEYITVAPDSTLMNRLRRRRGSVRNLVAQYEFLPATISHLLRIAAKYDLVVDLFAVGISQEEMDAVLDRLDDSTSHPFNHALAYKDIRSFVATLPYRPDLIGVVDVPQRGLMYGSRFMSLTGL